MLDKIKEFVNEYINPALQSHNGHLAIESFDEEAGILYVTMGGGCQGCVASKSTLQQQVKACLTDEFGTIKELIDMTNHDEGKNPFLGKNNETELG